VRIKQEREVAVAEAAEGARLEAAHHADVVYQKKEDALKAEMEGFRKHSDENVKKQVWKNMYTYAQSVLIL
jgi:hypothetical protein